MDLSQISPCLRALVSISAQRESQPQCSLSSLLSLAVVNTLLFQHEHQQIPGRGLSVAFWMTLVSTVHSSAAVSQFPFPQQPHYSTRALLQTFITFVDITGTWLYGC